MKLITVKHLFSDKTSSFLVLAIVFLVLIRILILPLSPPGFYVDEAATGAHVVAMVKHQTNAHDQSWPLFSPSLGGGFTTPVYLYPLSLWASMFGFSELSLRAFSQFVTILAILFIGLSMRLWLNKSAGLITIIIGLALPWGWLQGSLAWDPAMAPLMISLAFLGWSLLLTRNDKINKLKGHTLLVLGLILLAYVYPPYWVGAPILLIAAYATLYFKKRTSMQHITYAGLASAILVLPLINFILQPNTLGRSSSVSIFSNTSFIEAIYNFIINIAILINPAFLFVSGDNNLRHSTGFEGMLGYGAIIPILFIIYLVFFKKNHKSNKIPTTNEVFIAKIAVVGYIISIIGSALTIEGQPHSLRACGAWPFAVVLLVVGWSAIIRSKNQYLKSIAISVFVIGTISYAVNLAFYYPSISSGEFNVPERVSIFSNQPVQYLPLALKYYETR